MTRVKSTRTVKAKAKAKVQAQGHSSVRVNKRQEIAQLNADLETCNKLITSHQDERVKLEEKLAGLTMKYHVGDKVVTESEDAQKARRFEITEIRRTHVRRGRQRFEYKGIALTAKGVPRANGGVEWIRQEIITGPVQTEFVLS
jgi:septal ring factor EnvC (AmiA/AmiB activator)